MPATPSETHRSAPAPDRTSRCRAHSKGGGGLPRQRFDSVHVAFRIIDVFSDLTQRVARHLPTSCRDLRDSPAVQGSLAGQSLRGEGLERRIACSAEQCNCPPPASALQDQISKVGRIAGDVAQRLRNAELATTKWTPKRSVTHPNCLLANIVVRRLTMHGTLPQD